MRPTMVVMTPTGYENLFRSKALEALSQRQFGRPISTAPQSWRWITVFVICFAIVGSSSALTMEYARKESVRGWLVSEHGVARIRPDTAGKVDEVLLRVGDRVRAGDAIMVLSRERFLEDGSSTADAIQEELGNRIGSTQERERLLGEETGIEQETVKAQLLNLEQEIEAVDQQREEQLRRVEAAGRKLADLSEAARGGAVTEWDLLRQKDDLVAARQAVSRLQQAEQSLQRERHELQARLRRLPVETGRAIAALRSERSHLKQQLTESKSRRRVIIKAPISGKLAAVEVSPGDAVSPRQLLATVLPAELRLMAEVYVPSRAAGFIRPGQRVRLKYDAFPHRQFGTQAGTVVSISDFVLLPSEIPQTFLLREATFKVRVALENHDMDFAGRQALLRPGMLLGAEIILEQRTLADWLLKPLRFRPRDIT